MGYSAGVNRLHFGINPDLGRNTGSFSNMERWAFFDIEQYYSKSCGPTTTKRAGYIDEAWARDESIRFCQFGTNPDVIFPLFPY